MYNNSSKKLKKKRIKVPVIYNHEYPRTKMLLFFCFCLLQSIKSDLLADRLLNVERWINRTQGLTEIVLAWSDAVTHPNVTRIVREVGNFFPKNVAEEYDRNGEALSFIITTLLGSPTPIKILDVHAVFDISTTKWLSPNHIQIDYSVNIRLFNFTIFQLSPDQAYRFRDVLGFIPGTAIINLAFTYQDIAASKLFEATSADFTGEFLCTMVFMGCNVSRKDGAPGTYLPDTGFSTFAECVTFMNSFPPSNPCPYPQRSNTSSCRGVHASNTINLPEIHCSHVRPNSMVCTDSCLPACSNCHANAECIPSYLDVTVSVTPVYECKCKNGYVGNGVTCTPKNCSYGNCPALPGSYNCVNNLCMCTETFTHEPVAYGTNNLCSCPPDHQVIWNNSKPICVPPGRCIKDQWECSEGNNQSYTQIKCAVYNVSNTYTLFKSCLCNYGFLGGWEYPCICPSPKRILWSPTLNSDVCLAANECTATWHCAYPKTCITPPGKQIGSCL